MSQPTVAVIGAGFSGTLLSLLLQSLCPAGTRIVLIERSGRFGVGQAYSSDNPNHLLNVPAGRMGAFPDLPLDFLGWLRQQHPNRLGGILPTENAFVPRRLYGLYLQDLLDLALHQDLSARLELLDDHVVRAREWVGGVTLTTASGASLSADIVVLAIGNTPPPPLHRDIAALNVAGLWRSSPWEPAAFAALDPQAPVLLVGTGLTMVDAVISLLDAGHSGPIYALSRHGLLPRRHAAFPVPPAALPPSLPKDLAALTRWIRCEVGSASQAGTAWQPVIDSLRPVAQDIWRGLSAGDRKRFLRHMRTWWDVHRHRMPPQIADRIEAAKGADQLRVCAGRIVACNVDGGQATVMFRSRESGSLETLRAARVIDCTGSGTDITQSADRLLQALMVDRVARADPLRVGLDVSAEGAVVSRAGVASDRLFAIGPLTKGANWENTAVPELRRQCRDMAGMLAARLVPVGQPHGRASGRSEGASPVSRQRAAGEHNQAVVDLLEKINLFPRPVLRL
jgi:uncharacterized NAD(P)/FAD-binding protein YdhS